MSNHITLDLVDIDGAVRETEHNAFEAGLDRSEFFKKGALAGGSFLAAGVLFGGFASPAMAAISNKNKSKKNDVKILNYALTLEYLEAEFYKQAVANKAYSNADYQKFAEVVAEHEAEHVKVLKQVLGKSAVKKPTFDFKDTVTDPAKFAATAQVLEDTGVAAYAGQGPNILQRPVVVAALSIHSVEARHAAWVRFLNKASDTPAPATFDKAKSEAAILKAVTGTGFITG